MSNVKTSPLLCLADTFKNGDSPIFINLFIAEKVDKKCRKIYFKKMRNKILLGVFFFFLLSLIFTSHSDLSSKDLLLAKSSAADPQNVPVKKPKYDYMSTILSRNTKPLGLKEDPELEKLLKQPSIKWAIRAGKKHILD